MIEIRKLTKCEGSNVEDINRLLVQQTPGNNPRNIELDELQNVLENPYFHMFVALDEGKIIGMSTMFFQRNLARWIAEIHDIVVDENYRGIRLGELLAKKLLETAHEFCKEKDIKLKLFLTSRPDRIAANSLYEKLGFVLVSKAIGPWGTNLYKIIVEPQGFRNISHTTA